MSTKLSYRSSVDDQNQSKSVVPDYLLCLGVVASVILVLFFFLLYFCISVKKRKEKSFEEPQEILREVDIENFETNMCDYTVISENSHESKINLKPKPCLFKEDEFLKKEFGLLDISNHLNIGSDDVSEVFELMESDSKYSHYDNFDNCKIELSSSIIVSEDVEVQSTPWRGDDTNNNSGYVNRNSKLHASSDIVTHKKYVNDDAICTIFEARNGFQWFYFP